MRQLTIGNEYEMVFPFYKIKFNASIGYFGSPDTEACSFWYAGCNLEIESCENSPDDRFFTANAEGKVIYKILSIAEMPGRFKDRVIFKRWLIDPDGKKYNNGEVRMLTTMSFLRDIESRTPFKADYEVE